MSTPQGYLLLSAALFSLGLAAAVIRKEPVIILLGIGVALLAVNLAAGALASNNQDWGGQVLLLVLITISGISLAMGMVVLLTHDHGHIE